MHLEMLAAALVESALHVRLLGTIHYEIIGQLATAYVEHGKPLFPFFDVDRSEAGVFEYWLIISEILGAPSWRVTSVISDAHEYDDSLRRMRALQIVRAIPPPLPPSAELHADGTALLDVTLYTRAGEERIERRTLALDADNEFHFHGRVLLAEGRGGVNV